MRKYALDFENFISKVLEIKGYKVLEREPSTSKGGQADYLTMSPEKVRTIVEAKFYGSSKVPLAFLRKSIDQVIGYMTNLDAEAGLIITSAYIGKNAIEGVTGTTVEVWDQTIIYEVLSDHPALLEEFEDLLKKSQVFRTQNSKSDQKYIDALKPPKVSEILLGKAPEPDNKGKSICNLIRNLSPGREDAVKFEERCTEALKYLFDPYLISWKKQNTTKQGLHRFDLIARITAEQSDFWQTLLNLHRTRYIVFEFKNYTDPIGQNEVYGTEKYLYPNAMRSVAIVIARNGAEKNAMAAARGALRESGKVILILSLKELCEMLDIRDNGGDPSDILATKLDDMLMTIDR